MNDRPTAAELIAAVRQYLDGELLPALTDARLRFQTLVAANVLLIVERELDTQEDHMRAEWQWLAELLEYSGSAPQRLTALRQTVREGNEQLCRQIRQGAFDEPSRFLALSSQLRRVVERKLAVANPRYLAGFHREKPSGDGVTA